MYFMDLSILKTCILLKKKPYGHDHQNDHLNVK